MTYISHKQI